MRAIAFIFSILIAGNSFGQAKSGGDFTNPKDQTEELGKVKWHRNYDQALEVSAQTGKPVFLLFQEVPGCMTCRNYGHNVLSHPLMVELIENEFVPLAIFNNKGGSDRKVLEKYNEPAWNNPVVRILDAKGANLANRIAAKYSATSVLAEIKKTLKTQDRNIPKYVELLEQELLGAQNGTEEAVLSMYCFWSGEAHLGQQDGVLSTEPGFANGKEVVKVKFDPTLLSKAELASHGAKAKCHIEMEHGKFGADKDPQYYLKKSRYKYLPLSEGQRTKINSALSQQMDPDEYLSPQQKEWLYSGQLKNTTLYTQDFETAWSDLKGY